MTRTIRALLAAALTAAALTAAAPVATAAPACVTPWSSLPDRHDRANPSPVVDVRAGTHPCYDRVVVQIAGSVGAGWDVRYVDAVRQDGSGNVLPVAGGARLAVRVAHPAYDEAGTATYDGPAPSTAGHRTLRSVVFGGSFEGSTLVGVGTRARLPFRAFAMPGPGGDTRIVVDVAHTW